MVLILTTSFYCKCEIRKVLTPELYNVPMLPNVHFLNGKNYGSVCMEIYHKFT